MAEREINLKDQNEKLETIISEAQRQLAINGLQQIADRVAESKAEIIPKDVSPELIRKISRSVKKTIELLDIFNPVSVEESEAIPETVVRERTVAIPTTEEFKADVTKVEAEPELEVEATEKTETIEPSEELGSIAYDITEEGGKWLESVFKQDWKAKLKVTNETTAEALAEQLVRFISIRKPNTPERAIQIIVGKLHGVTAKKLAEKLSLTRNTVSMTYTNLKNQLSNLQPEKLELIEYSKKPAETISVTQVEPSLATEEKPVNVVASEKSPEAEAETTETVEELIARRFNFSGAEKAALTSFLNVKMRSDMTGPKLKIVEQLQKSVGDWLLHPTTKVDTDTITVLKYAFGIILDQGEAQYGAPASFNEVFNRVNRRKASPQLADSIREALYAIFDDAPKEDTNLPEQIATPEVEVVEPVIEELAKDTIEMAYGRVFDMLLGSADLTVSQYTEINKWFSLEKQGKATLERSAKLLLDLTPAIRRYASSKRGAASRELLDDFTRKYFSASLQEVQLPQFALHLVEEGTASSDDDVHHAVLANIAALYKAA